MVLNKIFGFLKEINKHYVDHRIDYEPVMEEEGGGKNDYIIVIGIRVKDIDEETIKNIIPKLDVFLRGLLKEGKLKIPISKQEKEKINKLSRIKLRLKGLDIADF